MMLPFITVPYWCMYTDCFVYPDMFFSHTSWFDADVMLSVELLIYAAILVGEALQAASQGWDVIQVQPPRLISMGLSAIGVLDIVFTLALTRSGHWPYFTPFIRPFLFLCYSHERLTNMINITRAIPAVAEIIALVFMVILFWVSERFGSVRSGLARSGCSRTDCWCCID